MKRKGLLRLIVVLFFFITLYLLVIFKLFYWQVVQSKTLQEVGRKQSTESLVVESKRGEILSSDNYPLVTNKYTYLLYANPKVVFQKDEYAQKLAPLVGVEEASISAQLSKDLFWVRLAASLDEKQKQSIEALKLEGIGFQQLTKRLYSEASMAAQLIGFVGKDENGKDRGYFGIEGYYNEQLQGREGSLYVIRDALGNTILNDIREEKKIDGRSLILTIDRNVQFIAEKKLKEGMEKYQAEGASVVIMESSTGKILGMASYPRFDPQKYWEFPGEYFVNPIISSLYEPGSTFKVLVMAAAIDQGVVKANTRCNICSGPVQIGEYSIKTWNQKYYPNSTMTEVIQHSDNIGMVFAGKKLGLSNLIKYLKKFGIGNQTRIDTQGETTGELRGEDSWYEIDASTATFGQGISITPLQLITGVNSIANKGNLVKPYVISKIITDEGKKITIQPEVKRKVISETTAKVVTYMMVNAVEKGEAKWAKLPEYKIAGKTGTAQIPVAGHYDPNQTITSFIGFFPPDKPRITMLVLYDRPKSSIYGAETAAPTFFSIAKELINYYNIQPE